MFLIGCAVVLACSCHRSQPGKDAALAGMAVRYQPYADIRNAAQLLQEGDLVVRMHQDPGSELIRKFNRRDKRYSHAGLVLKVQGKLRIFHVVNGEESPDERLRSDSLGAFCNPRKNAAFAIYRYDLSDSEIGQIRNLVLSWEQQGVRFDSAFDLHTNDRMYCSEMISKALATGTQNRITIHATTLTYFEAGALSARLHLPKVQDPLPRIIAIDNLYLNPHCHLVERFDLTFHASKP